VDPEIKCNPLPSKGYPHDYPPPPPKEVELIAIRCQAAAAAADEYKLVFIKKK
jgi:hypothetical protein